MYQPAIPVLYTTVGIKGFGSLRRDIYSNGTYLRLDNGRFVGPVSNKNGGIYIFGSYEEKEVTGHIKDKVLVERITYYWDNYLGKYHTNCAAFANYVTTGVFIECESKKNNFVLTQGMRPYEMAKSVGVGDMVCILYANDKTFRSRTYAYANRYRKVCKHRHDKGGFRCSDKMGLIQRSFTPEEVEGIYNTPEIDTYHFMVCVAIKHGKPLWFSQGGYASAGQKEPISFTLTPGETDSYTTYIPVATLIKKRR